MVKRLTVGCGPNHIKQEGEHTMDILPFGCVDFVHDLNITPWKEANGIVIKEGSYDEIIAVHVIEHLLSLISFMNECHRILSQGGALYLETPLAGGDWDLTHADPTHVRCYRPHTFINYFTRAEGPKFGYTDKYWAILHLEVKNNCIIFHAQPIKS